MRILLVGEYSLLHNSLKDGLQNGNHEVVLVGSGDGFKNLPADFLYDSVFCKNKIVNIFVQIIFRITQFDVSEIERGLRFWWLLPNLKNFDVVQLINESPVQTMSFFELFLLKKLFKNNKKIFVLSSGVDFLSVQHMIQNKNQKSILQPFFKDNALKKHYKYVFKYLTKGHQKVHNFVYQNCKGIIASDIDYVLPLVSNKKFLGLIPNPINVEKLTINDLVIIDKTIIFLGKNKFNAIQKGTAFFEDALLKIKAEFGSEVEILMAENVPYKDYINLYNDAHIILDQVYAHDQGYNALEAMAKGKVVFTGAETDFMEYYELVDKVAINAKPDVDYLVEQLRFLIHNPSEIEKISKNAKHFIAKHHNYVNVADQYVSMWNKN